MEIQWLGTAGFKIRTRKSSFLMDPFLSRNKGAFPCQPLTPKDLAPASHIFVSHGHFDHIMDIPAIAAATGAVVVCSPTAAQTLIKDGLDASRIQQVTAPDFAMGFDGIAARVFYSRHIRFDWPLVKTTLARMGRRLPGALPLFINYPCGRVLAWRFETENRSLLFFGSAGSTAAALEGPARYPVDILLLPLQGHTRICDRALEYVRILRPSLVIPHHQDDFFPPISQTVDIRSFVDRIPHVSSRTRVKVMDLNEVFSI